MAVRLTLDFYGDTQLDRTLERMAENVEDATPAWERLADMFAAGQRRQFATEGAAASGRWAPLSPAYAAWKARAYPGAKILHRTGALEESLTSRPFGVEHLTPHSMVVGSDVAYGAYHQRGDGLPQRRPVEFTETTRREWVKVLQRYLVTGRV